MKFLEKVIKFILNIISICLVLLVIVVVYNLIQINILKKNYSNFLGYTFFEIASGSMADTIEINDVIIVKVTDDVHTNDIITYEQDGEIITHRIIKEQNNSLITKGDANNDVDKPVNKQAVIGKVIKILPKVGIWIKVFSDSKVIVCVIITITFLGVTISSNNTEKKKKNRHSITKFFKNVRGISKNERKKEKKEE